MLTRLRYYLAACHAKCNQIVSFLPSELPGCQAASAAPQPREHMHGAPWPGLCDEEGTFGPLVLYTSPFNVFYFYLLGV